MKNLTPITDIADIGELIETGVARRESERLSQSGGTTQAQRYGACIAVAAAAVADALIATGVAPSTDEIFIAAGFTPTTQMRMDAVRAGRQIRADAEELIRKDLMAAADRANLQTRQTTSLAKSELDRVIADPNCGPGVILDAVIALRRASGVVVGRDRVTYEQAVELAVQSRSSAPLSVDAGSEAV